MTREEAKKQIEAFRTCMIVDNAESYVVEALNMAIEALEQEPTIEAYKQVCKERDIAIEQLHELGYEWGQKIEPCGDAISRREAIKKFKYNYKGERIPDYDCDNFPVQISIKKVREILKKLPPVNPEPKTGHWIKYPRNSGIVVCNQCKGIRRDCRVGYMNYCNRCGAKMESEEQE